MNSLKDFLDNRDNNQPFISSDEISSFMAGLHPDEKIIFLKLMRGHIKREINRKFVTYDAQMMYEHIYGEVLEWVRKEIEDLEDDLIIEASSISDEVRPGSSISRKQTALVTHFFKKYKIYEKLPDRKMGESLAKLSGYSEENLRRDLSINNLEIIINEIDHDKLVDILQAVIADIQNKHL